MNYVETMVMRIMDEIERNHINSKTAIKIVQQIIADTKRTCIETINTARFEGATDLRSIIERIKDEAKDPRLIDLPGVKWMIEAAYRAGFRNGWDCGVEDHDCYINLDEENNAYKYMKALEAK